jgi:hypothetical protein
MKPLILTYQGNDFDQAIEEARRRNPEHRGAVIAIPAGRLERLLRVKQAENGYEVSKQDKLFNYIKLLN